MGSGSIGFNRAASCAKKTENMHTYRLLSKQGTISNLRNQLLDIHMDWYSTSALMVPNRDQLTDALVKFFTVIHSFHTR